MATAAAADALTAPPARPVPADTAELVPDEAADAAVAPDAPVATEPKSSRTASPFLPILISGRRHDHADGRQTTYSGRAQLPGGQRLHDSTQRRGTYPTQPTVRQRSGARARSPPHPRHREDGAPLRPPRPGRAREPSPHRRCRRTCAPAPRARWLRVSAGSCWLPLQLQPGARGHPAWHEQVRIGAWPAPVRPAVRVSRDGLEVRQAVRLAAPGAGLAVRAVPRHGLRDADRPVGRQAVGVEPAPDDHVVDVVCLGADHEAVRRAARRGITLVTDHQLARVLAGGQPERHPVRQPADTLPAPPDRKPAVPVVVGLPVPQHPVTGDAHAVVEPSHLRRHQVRDRLEAAGNHTAARLHDATALPARSGSRAARPATRMAPTASASIAVTAAFRGGRPPWRASSLRTYASGSLSPASAAATAARAAAASRAYSAWSSASSDRACSAPAASGSRPPAPAGRVTPAAIRTAPGPRSRG